MKIGILLDITEFLFTSSFIISMHCAYKYNGYCACQATNYQKPINVQLDRKFNSAVIY